VLEVLLAVRAALRTIPLAVWGVIAAVVVIAGLMVWSANQGAARERLRADQAVAAANQAIEKRDKAARDLDADERVKDQRSADQEKEDLDNAVSKLPDARPDQREFALACERLRRQADGDRAAAAAGCRP
jgi:type II secretory pathway pseudopilin PulG